MATAAKYVPSAHKKKQGPFGKDYQFTGKEVVVIQLMKAGGCVRVVPDNKDAVDAKGNKNDENSYWEAEPLEHQSKNKPKARFRSIKTGKYLRITKGDVFMVDAAGDGGKFCEFIKDKTGGQDGAYKLMSATEECKGQCIGAYQNAKALMCGAGLYCDVKVFTQN